MHIVMIAVVENESGFKLLNSDTGKVMIASKASIITAMKYRNVTIANLKL